MTPELLAWIGRQPNSNGIHACFHRRGRSRRFPPSIRDWTPRQVAIVYQEWAKAPDPGLFQWGGAAGSGRIAPK